MPRKFCVFFWWRIGGFYVVLRTARKKGSIFAEQSEYQDFRSLKSEVFWLNLTIRFLVRFSPEHSGPITFIFDLNLGVIPTLGVHLSDNQYDV